MTYIPQESNRTLIETGIKKLLIELKQIKLHLAVMSGANIKEDDVANENGG